MPVRPKRNLLSIFLKLLAVLTISFVIALAGFVAGVKYHESASDSIRDELGMSAISGLMNQTQLIHQCETGRLSCDQKVLAQLWNAYGISLINAWAFYLATHDDAASAGMCSSIKRIQAKEEAVLNIQLMVGGRLGCSYKEPKPKPDAAAPVSTNPILNKPGVAPEPAISEEQRIEEIKRRIDRRRAKMLREAELIDEET